MAVGDRSGGQAGECSNRTGQRNGAEHGGGDHVPPFRFAGLVVVDTGERLAQRLETKTDGDNGGGQLQQVEHAILLGGQVAGVERDHHEADDLLRHIGHQVPAAVVQQPLHPGSRVCFGVHGAVDGGLHPPYATGGWRGSAVVQRRLNWAPFGVTLGPEGVKRLPVSCGGGRFPDPHLWLLLDVDVEASFQLDPQL